MGQDVSTFTIRHVLADGATRAHDFHAAHVGQYLFPRTIEEFDDLVRDACLFEAVTETGDMAAICYVLSGATGMNYEFGGVFVRDEHRGCGLADALGRVAIASQFAMGAPPAGAKMIAHVHEYNKRPRRLLEKLGFSHRGISEPLAGAPLNMERNSNGKVVGDVFEFEFRSCAEHADWADGFAGTVTGSGGKTAALCIDVAAFSDDTRGAMLTSLRAIATGYRST